jgi:serine/threonine protein kinase
LQQAKIVPVLAAGTSGGVPYCTMPFVTGESLRTLLTRGIMMSLHDQLNVPRDVARALAYAHGVVSCTAISRRTIFCRRPVRRSSPTLAEPRPSARHARESTSD